MSEANSRITPPRVHMNGTAKSTLIADFTGAMAAIRAARKAVELAAPHARDYYVRDDGNLAFRVAQRQHAARYKALDDMHAEFEALAMAVDDQPAAFGRAS